MAANSRYNVHIPRTWANPSFSFQYSHLLPVHVSLSLHLWLLDSFKEQPYGVNGMVLSLTPIVVRDNHFFILYMNNLHKIIRKYKFISQPC